MSMILLHHSFPVFFFIINAVWAVDNSHFDKRTMLLDGANDNSALEISDGKTMKRALSAPLVNAFVTGMIGHEKRHVRVEKDGGPAIQAILHGIIGMTTEAVSDLTIDHPHPSNGGCKWFGTAPFCVGHCQAEYDYIRSSNGRCSNDWFTGTCKPDPSFGVPCSTILGGNFEKRFCCKSDPSECTWSGRWMSAFTAHNIYCRYDNHGHCGHLNCSINHFNYQAQNSTEIKGDHCDQISLFGLKGKATCGYIAWYDSRGTAIDSWYKTK